MELILGLGMGRGSVFSFETLVLPASAQALFLSVYLLSGGVPGSAAVVGHPVLGRALFLAVISLFQEKR